MAVTSGNRWTDAGGVASGSTTNVLGGPGGVVAWSIAGAGLANNLNNPTLSGFTTTVELGTFLPSNYETILREAFALWAAVANIDFIEVADSGGAFGSVSYPTIRIGGGYIDGGAFSSTWGFGFFPAGAGRGGDIIFDSSNTNLTEANFRWLALHEIGHAIGLDHTAIRPSVMYGFFDNVLMLQADDIAGITAVYGAQDFGANSYYLPSGQLNIDIVDGTSDLSIYGNSQGNVIDGTAGTESLFGGDGDDTLIGRFGEDVLDGGAGIDTADYGFTDEDIEIDLSAGTVTRVATGEIDMLAEIENVTAGGGDDVIRVASVASGNRVDGGGGWDSAYLGYVFASGYAVSGSAAELTISGAEGTDVFVGIEDFWFADGTIAAAEEVLAGAILPGTITVSGVAAAEGDGGPSLMRFLVSRTGGHGDVSVNYATADGTATAGLDYVALAGTLNFSASVNSYEIAVTINGDSLFESDETFSFVLSGATNGATAGSAGIGTITNDDARTPEIEVLGNGNVIADGATAVAMNDTDFGMLLAGTNAVRTFTVNNIGSEALTLSKLKLPKGFTLVEALSASILPGESDTFQVMIDTRKAGLKTGLVTFVTNDADEGSFDFALAGNVVTTIPGPPVSGAGTLAATFAAESFFGLGAAGVIDLVSYAAQSGPAGVSASLLSPAKNTGFAAGDSYNAIEGLIGSAFNDTLTGDTGDNVLEGGDGADRLIGGLGIDAASYEHAAAAVLADLARSRNNTAEAAGDTYNGIENLIGSNFDDVLVGDRRSNSLTGKLGADVFRFNTVKDGGPAGDVITDFAPGEDLIGIVRTGFKIAADVAVGAGGLLDFAAEYFVTGPGGVPVDTANPTGVAATKNGHGQFLFNEATDQLWWDADGTGTKAATLLLTVANGMHLQAQDFLLT